MVILDEDNYLEHYGILRRSGRYPWGSGNNVPQRSKGFIDWLADMRSQGLTESEIAAGVGMSTTELRAANATAKNQYKQAQIGQAQRLKDKGWSNVAAAERMGIPESTYRALLEPGAKDRADVLTSVSNMLKKEVDEKTYIDIGSGVERHLGISKEKLNVAVAMLMEQGYTKHNITQPQAGTAFETRIKVLAPPKTTWGDVQRNKDKIQQITEFSDDGGRTFGKTNHDPLIINPKRVAVKYKEDGGAKADGMIYVRPGVDDISLGNSRYAQVRIKVGDNHYLKGMAMYKDDLPAGVDLLFNTNKSNTGNKLDAMKPITEDPDYPFGSVVRQILADPGTDKERVVSAMNIVGTKEESGVEGGWKDWSKNLSSQFLSKQTPALAKEQLDMTYERRKEEFDEIMSLTNPTIKKKLLESFAEDTDSAAVHLKAAHLPRQAWHVILPIESMPPNQVYAPNYRNGEKVALVRYPHGGTFEIPELTVNNRQPEAKNLLGGAEDAIGIHHSVAERLSGADFDGDTVLVIPNNTGRISISPALEGLKNFDPVASYPAYEGMKPISSSRMQQEMGNISNLITDMTIQQASHAELARAVRHSMVVIDSHKKNLNYRQSAIDNGIAKLKEQYQGSSRAGAATLISRKKRNPPVLDFKPRPQSEGGPIDKATGRKVFVPSNKTTVNKEGETVLKKVRANELGLADDANELSSGTPIEKLYANHSNKLKALANRARLEAINTPSLKYSPSAKKAYAKEVASLDSKLALVEKNRPLERQAQIIANSTFKAKKEANPHLEGDSLKKIKFQELEKARARTGARRHDIIITDDEWNAIQAGAISNHQLTQILAKADLDVVRQHATPRRKVLMTSAKTERAKRMLASGYTRADVADALGVSLSTLDIATHSDLEIE